MPMKCWKTFWLRTKPGAKGRLVSRVYVEEFIKTVKKFYLGLVVDWVAASTVLLIAPVTEKDDDDIVKLAIDHPDKLLKINLGLQKEIKHEQLSLITDFMQTQLNTTGLKAFLNRMLKVFYSYDATMLEINPIGISKNGDIWHSMPKSSLTAMLYTDIRIL